ncbi:MAG: DUF3142 domain-containing protein [Candidatus Melainabacteria bacterium]|nr:DUF3142 domain-containing protein [Candidatus Melainabacteria bacterium]
MPKVKRTILLAAASVAVLLLLGSRVASDALMHSVRTLFKTNGKPHVMLWAWETPSDLRWADPNEIGVAFLANTITLYENRIWMKPRMQPLKVAPNTFLTAVVRLERSRDRAPSLSEEQMDRVVAAVLQHSEVSGVKAVQIDFDARVSERPFYRGLLSKLRKQLPAEKELSMTALASWCIGDRWLEGTAADEVVPMFFSMGADEENVVSYLRNGRTVHSFNRQKAIGLAQSADKVNEALAGKTGSATLKNRTIYLFSARSWTKNRTDRLLRSVGIK